MGRSPKLKPKNLGKKLAAIRKGLEIETYEEMIAKLDCPKAKLHPSGIFHYERGNREPSLIVLLKYAQLAGISTDDLIDDSVKLPKPFK
jgi:transcriptional regulator with XRE-family HTH domain